MYIYGSTWIHPQTTHNIARESKCHKIMEGNCAPGSQGKYIYDIYFVKNPVDSGTILITYRSTEHKLAYFFTKSLQGHLFVKFRML